MKRSGSLQWGAVIFLLLASFFLTYQRLYKPRILIIHSYHPQMPWVLRLNSGIEKIFADKAFIARRYFYMHTKHKHSPRYLRHMRQSIQNTVRQWQPDVIIAFDPDAQNAVAHLARQGISTKIIFAGTTSEASLRAFQDNPNSTGIREKVPVRAMREILSLIFRNKRQIYYLSDDSFAARALETMIRRENWGAFHLVAHKRVKTVEEWQEAVQEANRKADILLVSVYHTLQQGRHKVNRRALLQWMNAQATIPVVGMYESFMGDGGLMAIAISSYEQGFRAAQMALQLVEKQAQVSDMPVLEGKAFALFIEKGKLKKQFPDIYVPAILDAFSRSQAMPAEEGDLSDREGLAAGG
ncbi:MAG: hypothetical protein JJT82_09080 [Legionellaceae bacterium]|nr:hypothetical protein [Legionellaceae bacterium]